MPTTDAAQPPEPGPVGPSVPVSRDAGARARRRAEVLRMLSRERRRQQRVEPPSVRWTGTETA